MSDSLVAHRALVGPCNLLSALFFFVGVFFVSKCFYLSGIVNMDASTLIVHEVVFEYCLSIYMVGSGGQSPPPKAATTIIFFLMILYIGLNKK